MERYQVPLYLAALALGTATGLILPDAAGALEPAINPILVALLYATFLGVPLTRLRTAVTDARFVVALLIVNFVLAPLVVAPLSRLVSDSPALLMGLLLVLLAPCVDYVMVFTRLAGGAWERILAASPVLMLTQTLLLPIWLAALAGQGLASISRRPFALAFIVMIALPLGLSALTQWASARYRPAARVQSGTTALMVPLMMATLMAVTASQIAAVASHLGLLVHVFPIFLIFAAIMPLTGNVVGLLAHQDRSARLALAFSGTTRNSLVVLPLALALPDALAPIVVVTQTLVELIVMVVYVRLLPRLIRRP
ncbi:sodium Bile acid symporter family protein [Actinomyces massiliensis F0489]|uniref:Sodium Bile acid symporter family protein n=2 Tax=Actinomyces TaxID=1654 RepID=J0NKT4_9ACTO|nr:sodium Bile acid symporter family protein [Actinomyces massiliensis F0489]